MTEIFYTWTNFQKSCVFNCALIDWLSVMIFNSSHHHFSPVKINSWRKNNLRLLDWIKKSCVFDCALIDWLSVMIFNSSHHHFSPVQIGWLASFSRASKNRETSHWAGILLSGTKQNQKGKAKQGATQCDFIWKQGNGNWRGHPSYISLGLTLIFLELRQY